MSVEPKSIYLSYARKADCSLIERLQDAVATTQFNLFQSGLEEDSGGKLVRAKIKYDEQDLDYGCSIEAFMKQIAESRHMILVISEEYLRSPYCMYECLNIHNEIENAFYPAVVFVKNSLRRDQGETILDFETGVPRLSADRLKAYWDNFATQGEDEHSKQWYRRYRDMAGELETWLVGKRLFENPDTILSPFDPDDPSDDVGQSERVQRYLDRALNPIESRYKCPSSDCLRQQSITAIDNILSRDSDLKDALRLQSPESITEILADDSAATFVINKLAVALQQEAAKRANTDKLNDLRLTADQLFGELVKYGLQIETLYHQLQTLNQESDRQAYAVSSSTPVPEMTASRLWSRPAAFRKLMTPDGASYRFIGEKEYLAIGENHGLDVDDTKQDAEEQIGVTLYKKLLGLYEARYDVAGLPQPSQAMLDPGEIRDAALDELNLDNDGRLIIKIEGLSTKYACELAKKLNSNAILKKIPVFFSNTTTENPIKMHSNWRKAIDKYYEARKAIER